jgi:hypothetical protein
MSDSLICDDRIRLMDEAVRYRDQMHKNAGRKPVPVWECGRGHRWDRTLDVAQNVRCMNCAAERRNLETLRLRDAAEARGGALLSRHYVDAATPLSWKCAYGHVWEAHADAASRHWCAQCARTVFAGYR